MSVIAGDGHHVHDDRTRVTATLDGYRKLEFSVDELTRSFGAWTMQPEAE